MFQEALILMAVGMITVFGILILVVVLGNLLIRLVNHFFPNSEPSPSPENISSAQVAAITAAVASITGGNGHIQHIEKIS